MKALNTNSTVCTPSASPLMTPTETSDTLGVTLDELKAMRGNNTGPKFYTISKRLIRYSTADVERWRHHPDH